VRVHAHVPEVGAERRLHARPHTPVERLPAAAGALDGALDVGRSFEASLDVAVAERALDGQERGLRAALRERGSSRGPSGRSGFPYPVVHRRAHSAPADTGPSNSSSATTLPIFWYSRRVA